MASAKSIKEKEVDHEERMIEVRLSFWTDGIAVKEGNIVPKHARSSGLMRVEPNGAHEIVPESPAAFHSLMDITSALEKVLIENGIVLHHSKKMRKYLHEE
ncbi:MAG: hypothetical protein PHT96_10650 [Syntrophorhabdaceae bacterium]|nr:hypothetical protein [Syntrophorhabdaceae bacterium]MDD4196849.1 hypothetical protein [Syntrophorhabdaceae bacterium]HOC45941.1 hypothetical protein [Syntrophorhabdaceae bacterium]